MQIKLVQLILIISITLIFGILVTIFRKGKMNIFAPIIFGIVASVVFGSINALLFLMDDKLTADKKFDKILEEKGIPRELVPLIVGSISASISILIASYLEHYFELKFEITKSPLFDIIGITIGTILISLSYIGYLEYRQSYGKSIPKSDVSILALDPKIDF